MLSKIQNCLVYTLYRWTSAKPNTNINQQYGKGIVEKKYSEFEL